MSTLVHKFARVTLLTLTLVVLFLLLTAAHLSTGVVNGKLDNGGIVCPPERPYYVSSGVVDSVCYASCQQVSKALGRTYVASSRIPFSCVSLPTQNGDIWAKSKEFDMTRRLASTSANVPSNRVCKPEDIAMFFSWVVYEYDPRRMTGARMSRELGYKRLESCGRWQIVNEIHNQTDLLNSHATIAVNDDAGVVVLAFKGTELDPERWKESFVDWIFINFCAALTRCELASSCTGTSVHTGFQKSVSKIQLHIVDQLERYVKAGYLLMLTGHSKGGAMSMLTTVLTHSAFSGMIGDLNRRIYNFHFGSPMTGDKSFVAYYDALVPNDRTLRFVNRFHGNLIDTNDLVTTVPGALLNYAHTKNERLVTCQRKYFGNPDPIPGISYHLDDAALLPAGVGCHFQQCYMDGILYGPPPSRKQSPLSSIRLSGDNDNDDDDEGDDAGGDSNVDRLDRQAVCDQFCLNLLLRANQLAKMKKCKRRCLKAMF